MAAKLSSSNVSKHVSKWVFIKANVSSVSFAFQTRSPPDIEKNSPSSTKFEASIHFLKNKLYPDNINRVLDSTIDLSSALKLFKWASLQKGYRHTVDSYSRIILKLGMTGNVQEMEGFCREMLKERCPNVEETLLALVDSFVRRHRHAEALTILKIMNLGNYKPPIGVFNNLLGDLVTCDEKDFSYVVFSYKEMVKAGAVPSVETLNFLLEALCAVDRVDSALDQFRRMSKKGCSPNSKTFEILIYSLCIIDRVDESIILLSEILELGCKLDPEFFSSIIPMLCKAKKPEEAIRLYRMMRPSQLLPDMLTYEVLVQCLCENLRFDEAAKLLEEMIESGLTPSTDMLVDVVDGFCKLGKFKEAKDFLEDNCFCDTSTYNSLLKCHCKADNIDEASRLLENMVTKNLADSLSWSIIIRRLCENLEIRRALEFLNRMIVTSYIPDSCTYSALIVGHCRLGNYENALQLFLQLCAKYWVLDPSSYSELIEGLCHMKKIKEAAEVFHYMSINKCSLAFSSFNVMIKEICSSGEVDEAIRIRSMAYYSGISCGTDTYNTIMRGLWQSDKAKYVPLLFSQMLVEGCALDGETYEVLIRSMCEENHLEDCALLFELLLGNGFIPDPETLDKLLLCMDKQSQLSRIIPTLNKLVKIDGILSPAMYNMLINGLWKGGHKYEAGELLDLMVEKGWVPDAFTHGLLLGTVAGKESNQAMEFENSSVLDKVSNILAEGLEEV